MAMFTASSIYYRLPYLLKVQLAGLPGLRLLYALYQYYCSSVHRRVADWSEAG